MHTLYDYIKYNNIFYSEINDNAIKGKIDRFVDKIRSEGLEDFILEFNLSYCFNARHFINHVPAHFPDFVSNFPTEISNKLISIWLHLDD